MIQSAVIEEPTVEEQTVSLTDVAQINTVPGTPTMLPADPNMKACNCKRSKCLKLYCECFANNRYCGAQCACNGCSNCAGHDDERLMAKE